MGSVSTRCKALNRLPQTSTAYSFISGKTFTVSYGYDANSNRTSMTDPQSTSTAYVFDTLNRITTLTFPSRTNYTFGYDVLSRRTQLTRPNGVATNYQYDNLSRLTSILHQVTTKSGTTTLDGATYVYDAAGNRTSKTDKRTNVTSTFSYDPLYELTQVVQGATTTESYSYDAVGNRLSSLGVMPYSYNSSNELTSTPNATYTYDKNGNTLTKVNSGGTTQYNWDFENRLTSVVLPGSGGTVSFKYDPFGRRLQKTSSAGTTNYVYDGANALEEVDGSGSMLARYVQSPGIDEPLAEVRGSTTSYYEADGLGSITSLSNSSAGLANSYTYDSYGNLTASSGTVVNPYRYAGREFDIETAIFSYRARYYDPTIGRFISEDPSKFNAGVDFYAYVWNSPLDLTDPLGLCAQFPKTDYCQYRGKAPSPADFMAKGKAFKDEFDANLKFNPYPYSAFSHGLGELTGDFVKGGPLDAQTGATGDNLQKASYANYVFGAFFAGAHVPLSDALSAANTYGFKQQIFGGAYKGRTMDSTYTHIPTANVQAIVDGYNDAIQGTLCEK